MALITGTKLGAYEILGAIGAGGFGAVYKARDTRLNRTVAIKVLSEHISNNSESRQRFEREAQAIAGLKHPNICVLYDVGQQDGTDFLVMEYIEGETLASRLTRGPLPLDQALKVAIEIADALDKAHRQGITHRDLKPGNIMLTKSGSKLLDFGLAKLKASPSLDLQASDMPTAAGPSELTAQGAILGTLQYMSPEQLDGIEADARSDIFAFGAVVYEMLTGRKAFEGRGQSSVIAVIMKGDPPAISSLQPMTPLALERVVKMCLAKDPDDRWQSAHDLYSELCWIANGGAQSETAAAPAPSRRVQRTWMVVAAVMLLVSAALAMAIISTGRVSEGSRVSFSVDTPWPALPGIALSPDGKHLVALLRAKGVPVLWVRALENLEWKVLPGTELPSGSGGNPFWSPDGRFIAFFAGGKLKKVDLFGSPPQAMCDLPNSPGGGTWNSDGVIVFGSSVATGGPLFRVSASGGVPTPLTELDKSREEKAHAIPAFLPDGKHFLYLAVSAKPENSAIYVGTLDSKERKLLMASTQKAMFAPPDRIVFVRDTILMAQSFDPKRLELLGEPFPLAQVVKGPFLFDSTVSLNGILAYRSGSGDPRLTQLLWYDRSGKQTGSIGDPGLYIYPALSRDIQDVAVAMTGAAVALTGALPPTLDIWIKDLIRGTDMKLTFGPKGANNNAPMWAPDGSRIVFQSSLAGGAYNLYLKNSGGLGSEEVLLKSDHNKMAQDWSFDGKYILYSDNDPKTGQDLWVLPMSSDGKPGKQEPVLQTPFNEVSGKFSPDGKWIAYDSDETGTYQIYVQSFPISRTKYAISNNGGYQPYWRRDGKELFFLSPAAEMMAVEISTSKTGGFHAGAPQKLFQTHAYQANAATIRSVYDVTPDGQRFLILSDTPTVQPITVIILNWMSQGQPAKAP